MSPVSSIVLVFVAILVVSHDPGIENSFSKNYEKTSSLGCQVPSVYHFGHGEGDNPEMPGLTMSLGRSVIA